MSDATSARSYRPGSWYGIFGDHVTVVLPPSEKDRVAQLWALVDEGAGFDEVLDALISGGLRELPGFVLVSAFETDTKVVVRGPARATFTTSDGPVELAGSTATTWVERSMTGVTGMVIDVSEEGAEATGPDHTVENALVRVSRVDDPPYTAEVADVPDETADAPDETADVPDETADVPDGRRPDGRTRRRRRRSRRRSLPPNLTSRPPRPRCCRPHPLMRPPSRRRPSRRSRLPPTTTG